ncbi:uncharacterized protein LOC143822915 [Paroedura picta]|uniref:uncharacterized protein LOC143822915 n=1 Tax=Paroedura picta TaxID=143630 RepID=UPI0040564AC4
MDADARICLSFLYKNDPFYSLCLSDLMAAPQRVQNTFLKEQKNLTMTVKKLEHQKLTRLRQLNEEKRQFSLLMKKRLAPALSVRRGSSLATERGSQRISSSIKFSSLASSDSGWKSAGAKPGPKAAVGVPSVVTQELPASRTSKLCKVNSVPGASGLFHAFSSPRKAKATLSKEFTTQKKGEFEVTLRPFCPPKRPSGTCRKEDCKTGQLFTDRRVCHKAITAEGASLHLDH